MSAQDFVGADGPVTVRDVALKAWSDSHPTSDLFDANVHEINIEIARNTETKQVTAFWTEGGPSGISEEQLNYVFENVVKNSDYQLMASMHTHPYYNVESAVYASGGYRSGDRMTAMTYENNKANKIYTQYLFVGPASTTGRAPPAFYSYRPYTQGEFQMVKRNTPAWYSR